MKTVKCKNIRLVSFFIKHGCSLVEKVKEKGQIVYVFADNEAYQTALKKFSEKLKFSCFEKDGESDER